MADRQFIMQFFLTRRNVLWAQVFGLAAVQGAIALMWVIYNLYLPPFLTQLGFPKEFVLGLLFIENLLQILMEPLMGGFSDQAQRWLGSRFPFIAIGVIVSSTLFISLPAIVLLGNPVGVFRWLLPIAMVAWAIAMTTFRSPVLSLLGQYAFATNLPQAASVLVLVGTLIRSVGVAANQFLLSLGPVVTFAAGSVVMVVAAAVLQMLNPEAKIAPKSLRPTQQKVSWLKLLLVFGAGVGISLGSLMVMRSLFNPALPSANIKLMLSVFTLVNLVTILPAGFIAARLHNRVAMVLGLAIAASTLVLLAIAHTSVLGIGLAVVLGTAWSFVSNGALPFALSMVPADKAGLGTGLYFGGGAFATSVFSRMAMQMGNIPPALGAIIAAIAFVGATVCIVVGLRLQKNLAV